MSIFKSILDLAGDVAEIVVAPMEIALDATRVVTKPVADVAKEVVKEVKEVVDDITD